MALTARNRILLSHPPYHERALAVRPSNLIGYWPLWEGSGSVATDYSGQANHGAYTGVDLGKSGPGGAHCPYFDGVNDFVDVYGAGLAADFSAAEGTLLVWAKANGATVWTDATLRRIAYLGADANNRITLQKLTTDNTLNGFYYSQGGAGGGISIDITASPTGWFCLGLTWSAAANKTRVYYNGTQQGADGTCTAFTGALASTLTVLGAASTTPVNVWQGYLAHVALWNTPLTATEIAALSRL